MGFIPSCSRVFTQGVGAFALAASLFSQAIAAAEVNVYSARKEALIKPLLDQFTESSGIAVNLVTGKGDALLSRLQSEGRNSPADLLITTDVGRLYRAEQAGVLQPVDSDYLLKEVPAHLRSPKNDWFGLSVRARAIVYAKDRVKLDELSSYEDLASAKWKGRICVRSSSNIYNQSMVAGMLATEGDEKTAAWLKGFVSNFARRPQGGDRDQVLAVAAGQCDVALVNSYYLGAMVNGSDAKQRAAADKVSIFWPNQADRGTHINISGAGITAVSKNREQAVALLEFLVKDDSQRWYAEVNNEYPIRANIAASELLQSWGEFKRDDVDASELGRLNRDALMAMDRANWR